jgi:hypothetical protein
MAPDTNVIRGGVPQGSTARALSQPEQQYAIYIGPTAPPASIDQFSVRWTGKLRAPRTGDYVFSTLSNDGVRLTINETSVINNWTQHSATEDKGTISLQAGKLYDFKLEYYQAGGNAVMKLAWQPPRSARIGIPPNAFVNSSRTAGLIGEYYKGENFDTLVFKRIDPAIDFDWTGKSPFDPTTNPAMLKTIELQVDLPRGDYVATWINTLTGAADKIQPFTHRGGIGKLVSAPYYEDIALDLRRAPPRMGKQILNIQR